MCWENLIQSSGYCALDVYVSHTKQQHSDNNNAHIFILIVIYNTIHGGRKTPADEKENRLFSFRLSHAH